ncbi:catalase-like protein [Meira miltonrushii]|uniref:Catalase-like protein n=1 Tax=Meira miltonrushii TaxID=1280837 RepID=A0A316V9I0_9BASI|nr:catalase-like protein [Meira miltonrushii]PWN33904.1 catalase-like protein [Meira miltonrushii]
MKTNLFLCLLLAVLQSAFLANADSMKQKRGGGDTSTIDLFAGLKLQQAQYMTDKSNSPGFTTENGAPSSGYFNIQRAGQDGPLLIQSTQMLDSLAHFVRERIPERIVHARGWGAWGKFEVTTDFAEKYSFAPAFKKGAVHPILMRFSTVGGQSGSPDAARDPRGFAIKIKTKQGVLDWVFNNTPVFFIRNPLKFPVFIHTQKTNPQTNERDPNMVFDYLWQNPEASMQFMRLFSDLGTPYGARHMNGWSGHTYRLVKQDGSWVYVKVQLFTDQGIKNFTAAEATQIGGENQEWATKDLFDSIEAKQYPSWTVKFAVKTPEEGKKYRYNVNDLTKDWLDATWYEVGKMTLNQNPRNYFDEIESSHFSPSNMVPGWAPSEDPVLQSRLFSYNDAGRYRIGSNYNKLPVNCPFNTVGNYDRSGVMPVTGDYGNQPIYPSSAGTYKPASKDETVAPLIKLYNNATIETYVGEATDIDYEQPRYFYQHLSANDKKNLHSNFAGAMSKVTQPNVVSNVIKMFNKIDPNLAKGVTAAIAAAKKG